MTFSGSRIIQIIGLSTVLVILVFAVHIYSSYSRFRQQAGLDVNLKVCIYYGGVQLSCM